MRVQRYIRQISTLMQIPNLWELEIAGLMSQLGCVTLHPDTIEAAYAAKELDRDEKGGVRYEVVAAPATPPEPRWQRERARA